MNQSTVNVSQVEQFLKQLQADICTTLESFEPTQRFLHDEWERPEGGGGQSRVLADGAVFEKAGVNFSNIRGSKMPATATARNKELAGRSFQAMGVSVVIHPLNPKVPTSHMNVRFFIAESETAEPIWWFGGGFDLTPYYGFDEDAIEWHQMARQACDINGNGEQIYQTFKKWCDDYFHIKHRNEQRGIGGLFFDDLNEDGFEPSFALMKSVGEHFMKAYEPIVARRHLLAYNDAERQFQLYRRGRYVEFNLVYDRGTLFGLQSNGRVESILMSMPPLVRFEYDWTPEPDSPEANLYNRYLVPRDWLKEAQ